MIVEQASDSMRIEVSEVQNVILRAPERSKERRDSNANLNVSDTLRERL